MVFTASVLSICRVLHLKGYDIHVSCLANGGNPLRLDATGDSNHIVSSKPQTQLQLNSDLQNRSGTLLFSLINEILPERETAGWQLDPINDLADLITSGDGSQIDVAIVDWQDQHTIEYLSATQIDVVAIWSPVPPLPGPSSNVKTDFLKTGWDYLQSRLSSTLPSSGLAHIPTTDRNRSGGILDRESPAIPIYSSYASSVNYAASTIISSTQVIGPLVKMTCPSLTATLRSFLDAHERVLYIALGHRTWISQINAQQIVEGCILALEEQFIDAVLWNTGTLPRNTFWDVYDRLVDNRDPHWMFSLEGSEPAILAHRAARLFFSSCDSISLVHAAWHGVPMLALDRDHEQNAEYIESLGIALVIPFQGLDARMIRESIGRICLDIYGSFGMRVAYVQRIVTGNGEKTEAIATEIDTVIRARKVRRQRVVDGESSCSS